MSASRTTVWRDLAVVVESAAVVGAIGLFTSAKTVQPYMWVGAALIAASFLVRWLATGSPARRTPLDWAVLLFLVSAVIGVWAAYDRPVAAVKLLHIVAGIALYYLLASRASLAWFGTAAALALSLAGAGLAIVFVTQYDFAADPGKVAIIKELGRDINGVVPRLLHGLPSPNIIAGVLLVALPLSVAAALGLTGAGRWTKALRAVFAVCSVLMLSGVIMTMSRGAWLALGAVGVATAGLAWGRSHVPERWQGRLLPALVLIGAACAILLLSVGDGVTRLLGTVPGVDRAINRAELFGQVWQLIQEYFFTGSGLGMFGMVYSSYSLLIWVRFLPHAHNLFLQLWIEQGLLGFIAILGLFGGLLIWAWQKRRALTWLSLGALAAAGLFAVHGLGDNPLYAFRVLPLMFVPFGLAMGEARKTEDEERRQAPGLRFSVAALALMVTAVAAREQIVALWYTNLGSVAQTRTELAGYSFPDHLVDDVRHSDDLSAARGSFQLALADDPGAAGASNRLGLIMLGRGEHQQAFDMLQRASQRNPGDVITRELLGEAYLGLGQLDEAYKLCSTFPGAATRLEGIAWVRYSRYGDAQRSAWATAVAQRISGGK